MQAFILFATSNNDVIGVCRWIVQVEQLDAILVCFTGTLCPKLQSIILSSVTDWSRVFTAASFFWILLHFSS